MKSLFYASTGLLAVALTVGCERTTTTGPAPTTPRTTTTPHDTTPPTTTTPPSTAEVKKLTLMAMKSQTIKQGDTDEILVTINRDHFDDAVSVGLEGLPKGVALTSDSKTSIASGDSTVTLKVKAADDADVGEHKVTLFAQAPGVDKNTQVFTLTVNKK